jgi:glycosyltransferase involved in cell wall biosynthesis
MEKLRERGFVSVLAARAGTPIIAEALKRGLVAYPIPMRTTFDVRAMAWLAWIMHKHRIDVVNAHSPKDAWNAALVARLLGRKVIRSRHVASPIKRGRIAQQIYRSLCDRIMTTSESIKQGMIARGIAAEKIVPVPTGVDVSRFQHGQRGALRVELGIPAEAKLVGMVSVLRGDNGPDIFLQAAEQVLSSRDDIWFVLAGDGPLRPRLEAMREASSFREHIVLLGHRRDIPEIFADLDIFVLAARISGGVPQAILQAHAARVPVVATSMPGVTEVAIAGKTAVVVPPGDAGALAEAITGLIAAPQTGKALAEAGHQLVLERYTLDAMADCMASLYSEVVAASKGGVR